MKIYLPLVVLLLASCSMFEKKKPELVPVRYTLNDIQECRDYQKDVLDKSYKEVTANKDVVIVFTNDVKEARESFSKFDVKKSMIDIKVGLMNNVLQSCDENSLKQFDQDYKQLAGCQLMFSELRYFQSLASALNRYPWPIDLQLEGKKTALDYVRFYSEGKYPLLNRLIALSVLDELSVNQIVNKDLHPEIKLVMEDAQRYVEQLQKKLTTSQSLTCEGLDIMSEELIYSEDVAKKMQGFLKRI